MFDICIYKFFMCRIDLCGQIGVKISSYGDRKFIKINPLNCPMGQFIPREDIPCGILLNNIIQYLVVYR